MINNFVNVFQILDQRARRGASVRNDFNLVSQSRNELKHDKTKTRTIEATMSGAQNENQVEEKKTSKNASEKSEKNKIFN